jgi:DNA-binding LytR/AlgR family response regulator
MTSRTNCLIIDDEPLARSLIRTFLLKRTAFHITGECINPTEAYELLLNNDIDVIFLDIQMPVISGIDFLQSLKHPPKIIFTTAHSDFAADAFNLNAVDYIVKPITEERFEQALEKLKSAFVAKEPANNKAGDHVFSADYIFFKTDGKLVKVQFDEILYLEALKDFTKVYLSNEKTILVGDHLKAVENHLPATLFLRAHRSFVVSLKAITGIFGNTIEIGKIQLPVGGNYRDQLFKVLNIK